MISSITERIKAVRSNYKNDPKTLTDIDEIVSLICAMCQATLITAASRKAKAKREQHLAAGSTPAGTALESAHEK